jgi:hypothetical protein
MDKTKKRLITELSIKYKLPFEVIELLVNSQFQFVSKTMKEMKLSKEYKTILLHKLGKFTPSLRKIKIYENRNNNKELLELPDKTKE